MNEIVALDRKAVAEYTSSDIAICKRYIRAENATEQEWQKLVLLATKYMLNPLTNEIWILPGVGVTIGLAGMVKIAERSGKFDGLETETTYDADGKPFSHTCRVWRKDMGHPISKTIIHREFARPGKDGKLTNWDKMPVYMGEKIAEVHALKRAFSLMDLYTPEEYGYADDRSGAEPYQGAVDGAPVPVEPMTRSTTPAGSPAKCPRCGREPMIPLERQQVQMGFVSAGLKYDLPEHICKDCATEIFKQMRQA